MSSQETATAALRGMQGCTLDTIAQDTATFYHDMHMVELAMPASEDVRRMGAGQDCRSGL